MSDERRGSGGRSRTGDGASWDGGAAPQRETPQDGAVLPRGAAAPETPQEKTEIWRGDTASEPASKKVMPSAQSVEIAGQGRALPSRVSASRSPSGQDPRTTAAHDTTERASRLRSGPTPAVAATLERPFEERLVAWGRTLRGLVRPLWHWLRDRVLHAGRAVIVARLQRLTTAKRGRFEVEADETDTYDRARAKQWQEFNKGKRSGSYLPKVDD